MNLSPARSILLINYSTLFTIAAGMMITRIDLLIDPAIIVIGMTIALALPWLLYPILKKRERK